MEGLFGLGNCVFVFCLFLLSDSQLFTCLLAMMVCQLAIAYQKQHNYVNNPTSSCPAANVLGILQINRLVRENLKIMIALFLIAIAVFIYMIYVLIKPEKF
ncbi:potassium-transporting ATPase subunit F [Pedobacter nyackensis]|uniref:K+-transporting ATPase, KdpF subunit n=1 Tax=Pedobacter nyackensis TaxID=475255 RepID=A0A1W2ERL9_9SPHI|nr:potassium-transporting ATPase subunit F [Pedobacter nyackensis]SMD12354.1 K+-transporting ATPase, KdpF subunit [Pedobacter nyackensis]